MPSNLLISYQRGESVHGITGPLCLFLHSSAVVLLRREDLRPDDPHLGEVIRTGLARHNHSPEHRLWRC